MRDKLEEAIKISRRFQVSEGRGFKLKDISPADTAAYTAADKPQAAETLQEIVAEIARLQEVLYADNHYSLLLIFQALDAAGKDSAIKHVLSGVNPQGCQVVSFKTPSDEELDHDYLWRCIRQLPERGRIGVFNRSYYEEVLVVRVHPEYLDRQNLPPKLVNSQIWQERFEDISNFERYLTRNGVVIRKFFLHLSADEQRKRLLARLDRPEKNWKFMLSDLEERKYWAEYQKVYEAMVRNTATLEAPWHVLPADNKWFTRLMVGSVILEALRSLELKFPQVDEKKRNDLLEARKRLA